MGQLTIGCVIASLILARKNARYLFGERSRFGGDLAKWSGFWNYPGSQVQERIGAGARRGLDSPTSRIDISRAGSDARETATRDRLIVASRYVQLSFDPI